MSREKFYANIEKNGVDLHAYLFSIAHISTSEGLDHFGLSTKYSIPSWLDPPAKIDLPTLPSNEHVNSSIAFFSLQLSLKRPTIMLLQLSSDKEKVTASIFLTRPMNFLHSCHVLFLLLDKEARRERKA